MANGSALVQNNASSLLQLGNDRAGTVSCCLNNLDTLVDDGLCISTVVWRVERRKKGDVDTEGVLGKGPALLNLLAEVGRRREDQRGDNAQATGVGDGRGKLSIADVLERMLTIFQKKVDRAVGANRGRDPEKGSRASRILFSQATYHHAALHDGDCTEGQHGYPIVNSHSHLDFKLITTDL